MPNPVKQTLDKVYTLLEQADKELHNLIVSLDFDPVAGNSPNKNSTLDCDLYGLNNSLTEARNDAAEILHYQRGTKPTFNPRKVRR